MVAVVAEPGPVRRSLLAAAREITDGAALAEQVCLACVDGLDVDGAAISVLTDSPSRETLFASDVTVARIEELQYTLGEGVCVEAAETGRAVLVPDLGEAVNRVRWPVFAEAVVEQTEIGALFAVPLQLGTINLGVLDLYRTAAGSLDEAELIEMMRVTEAATMLLVGPRTGSGEHLLGDWSASGHAEVHQATGMLIAQLGVSAQEAFARLRGYSFAQDRLLSDVARDVVTRRLRFTEEML